MLNTLISFIVPVYNVKEYLEECVGSILAVSSATYEIILIDDGSTDGSGEICDSLSRKNPKIKVYHKSNGGLSSARNTGLQYASGEYVLFVDSDDYVSAKAVEAMLIRITKGIEVDVFFLKGYKVFKDGRHEDFECALDRECIYDKSPKEVLAYLAGMKKYPGSACTKLVKKSLIERYSIYFCDGKTSEDLDWCVRLFLAAKQYDYIDEVYYFYRQGREGSITNVYSEFKFCCLKEVIEHSCRLAGNEEEAIRVAIYSFMAYEYVIALLYMYYIRENVEKEKYKAYLHFFEEYKFLLSFRNGIKIRVLRFVEFVGGPKTMVMFVGVYDRLRRWKRWFLL